MAYKRLLIRSEENLLTNAKHSPAPVSFTPMVRFNNITFVGQFLAKQKLLQASNLY